MASAKTSTGSVTRYEKPSLVVIALGAVLGLLGLTYQIFHPEPAMLWFLETALILVPAALVVFGGNRIATYPLERDAQWAVAVWVVVGAAIAGGLVAGYVFTELQNGGAINEVGRLILLGLVGGALISLFATVSTQRDQIATGDEWSDEDSTAGDAIASSQTASVEAGSNRVSVSRVSNLLNGAYRVYREAGIRAVAISSRRFVSERLADIGVIQLQPYHLRKRTDSTDRWEMIRPHLEPDAATALDIGCASGFFSARLAEEGLLSIGMDVNKERVETARRIWGEKERVGFVLHHLDPENISRLPSFDVVCLLTVYHHWCGNFGRDNAETMLRELARNTETIFFEPPGEATSKFAAVGERSIADDESIVEYYSSLLDSIFGDGVEIEYLGEAEYPSSRDRTDPLFVIDCSGYE